MTTPGTAHLRVARPTDHLDDVARFYREGLGFEVVGGFEDHDGFDGVMLGAPGGAWHLELTHERGAVAGRAPNAETLLVFYLPDESDFAEAVARLAALGHAPVRAHNPYWDAVGKTFEDPDGYRVVLARRAWESRGI